MALPAAAPNAAAHSADIPAGSGLPREKVGSSKVRTAGPVGAVSPKPAPVLDASNTTGPKGPSATAAAAEAATAAAAAGLSGLTGVEAVSVGGVSSDGGGGGGA